MGGIDWELDDFFIRTSSIDVIVGLLFMNHNYVNREKCLSSNWE